MSNPQQELPEYEPHPTRYVLRVHNGRGTITPPRHHATAPATDPARPSQGQVQQPKPQVEVPVVHHCAPPSSRSPSAYGIYVYERWPGQTVIEAVGSDGLTVFELLISSQLVQLPLDAERVRSFLRERAPVRHLCVL